MKRKRKPQSIVIDGHYRKNFNTARFWKWACFSGSVATVYKAWRSLCCRRNGAAKRSCVMERQRKARELFNAVLEAAERYRNERKAIRSRSEWFVYDDRNGDLIGIVWAASEDEAHEAAMIDMAESGRDREMDYCGFYVEERR